MEKLPKNFDKNSDGWVNIEKSGNPKESKEYFIYVSVAGRKPYMDRAFYIVGVGWEHRITHWLINEFVTHWRELPAPPKD